MTEDQKAILALTKEVARLERLVKRLALALRDTHDEDYPWQNGSRAEKALETCYKLRLFSEKP